MLDLNRLWRKTSHGLVLLALLLAMYSALSDGYRVHALYQTSPLAAPAQGSASPLATPVDMVTAMPAVANSGNQTSLILVGIVLLSVLFIIALVMWRQKQK